MVRCYRYKLFPVQNERFGLYIIYLLLFGSFCLHDGEWFIVSVQSALLVNCQGFQVPSTPSDQNNKIPTGLAPQHDFRHHRIATSAIQHPLWQYPRSPWEQQHSIRARRVELIPFVDEQMRSIVTIIRPSESNGITSPFSEGRLGGSGNGGSLLITDTILQPVVQEKVAGSSSNMNKDQTARIAGRTPSPNPTGFHAPQFIPYYANQITKDIINAIHPNLRPPWHRDGISNKLLTTTMDELLGPRSLTTDRSQPSLGKQALPTADERGKSWPTTLREVKVHNVDQTTKESSGNVEANKLFPTPMTTGRDSRALLSFADTLYIPVPSPPPPPFSVVNSQLHVTPTGEILQIFHQILPLSNVILQSVNQPLAFPQRLNQPPSNPNALRGADIRQLDQNLIGNPLTAQNHMPLQPGVFPQNLMVNQAEANLANVHLALNQSNNIKRSNSQTNDAAMQRQQIDDQNTLPPTVEHKRHFISPAASFADLKRRYYDYLPIAAKNSNEIAHMLFNYPPIYSFHDSFLDQVENNKSAPRLNVFQTASNAAENRPPLTPAHSWNKVPDSHAGSRQAPQLDSNVAQFVRQTGFHSFSKSRPNSNPLIMENQMQLQQALAQQEQQRLLILQQLQQQHLQLQLQQQQQQQQLQEQQQLFLQNQQLQQQQIINSQNNNNFGTNNLPAGVPAPPTQLTSNFPQQQFSVEVPQQQQNSFALPRPSNFENFIPSVGGGGQFLVANGLALSQQPQQLPLGNNFAPINNNFNAANNAVVASDLFEVNPNFAKRAAAAAAAAAAAVQQNQQNAFVERSFHDLLKFNGNPANPSPSHKFLLPPTNPDFIQVPSLDVPRRRMQHSPLSTLVPYKMTKNGVDAERGFNINDLFASASSPGQKLHRIQTKTLSSNTQQSKPYYGEWPKTTAAAVKPNTFAKNAAAKKNFGLIFDFRPYPSSKATLTEEKTSENVKSQSDSTHYPEASNHKGEKLAAVTHTYTTSIKILPFRADNTSVHAKPESTPTEQHKSAGKPPEANPEGFWWGYGNTDHEKADYQAMKTGTEQKSSNFTKTFHQVRQLPQPARMIVRQNLVDRYFPWNWPSADLYGQKNGKKSRALYKSEKLKSILYRNVMPNRTQLSKAPQKPVIPSTSHFDTTALRTTNINKL